MYNKQQFLSRARLVKQYAVRPEVAVVGCYHGGNLGDMALGRSVEFYLKQQNVTTGLQTIYNLNRWPVTKKCILGGGAIAYKNSLNQVYQRYEKTPENVAILGVDFNESDYSGRLLDFLKEVSWISCRSAKQVHQLRAFIVKGAITSHPDIAFALPSSCVPSLEKEKKHRRHVLINLVPLYAQISNSTKVSPDTKWSKERPELYEYFSKMHATYQKIARDYASSWISKGYKVLCVPFTPLDDAYGRIALEGLPVTYLPYTSNPTSILRLFSDATDAFVTRLHATIFAIKSGISFTPIAYAKKNEELIAELGISRKEFVNAEDLAHGNEIPRTPISIEASTIQNTEDEAIKAINDCISSLLAK